MAAGSEGGGGKNILFGCIPIKDGQWTWSVVLLKEDVSLTDHHLKVFIVLVIPSYYGFTAFRQAEMAAKLQLLNIDGICRRFGI